jgi:hypothetical protein
MGGCGKCKSISFTGADRQEKNAREREQALKPYQIPSRHSEKQRKALQILGLW